MKTFALALVAVSAASNLDHNPDALSFPPSDPLESLTNLRELTFEWLEDNLKPTSATHWKSKFYRQFLRSVRRFELCGSEDWDYSFDEDLCQNVGQFCYYDKNSPKEGILTITTGFQHWANFYTKNCRNQPTTLVRRMTKWFWELTTHLD